MPTPRPVVLALLAGAATGFVATPRLAGAPILSGDGTRPSMMRLQHNVQGGYLLSLERGSRNLEDEEDVATRKCGSGEIGGGDPYAPGVAEKYSLAGSSDTDGFDESADAVGPGIYGGSVRRDADGTALIGAQHENHNHRPGPLYDGNGCSLMARAIHAGPETVQQVSRIGRGGGHGRGYWADLADLAGLRRWRRTSCSGIRALWAISASRGAGAFVVVAYKPRYEADCCLQILWRPRALSANAATKSIWGGHHEQLPPSSYNESAPNFDPSASIFEIRRFQLLSRTRLAEISSRANFGCNPSTFANGPSHVLWARGLGVRVWAHATVERAAREVVCRGGSTAPPSPTIGRGKGGAEEPPPPRQRRGGREREAGEAPGY